MARILLMEDEPEQAHLLGQAIKEGGHDVVIARSGQEALARLQTDKIDLVVTDIFVLSGGRLTADGGILLIGRMRASRSAANGRRLARIPIIAVTGRGSADHAAQNLATAQSVGAGAVFAKPIDFDVFLETIARLLGEGQ